MSETISAAQQQQVSSHLGEFKGQGKTVAEYDRIALSLIKPSHLKIEDELFGTKWFDYRMLHPTEATFYFAHVYLQILREQWARDVDYREAEHRASLPDNRVIFKEPKAANNWWKARQAADACGARYSVFIRGIFVYARDNGWSQWHGANLAQNRNIYPPPGFMAHGKLLEAGIEAWQNEAAAYMQRYDSPLLRADSNAWFKVDFDRHYCRDAQGRSGFAHIMRRALDSGLLSATQIQTAIGVDITGLR